MGINLFGGSYGRCLENTPKDTDPNPKRFSIKSIEAVNDYTIAKINYPNCIPYKGNKILVFKGDVRKQLRDSDKIDPHFLETGLSPVARFAANYDGLKLLDKIIGI